MNLLKTIAKYREFTLSRDDTQRISNAIKAACLIDKNAKKDHVKALKSEQAVKAQKVGNNECPKCGGRLVERNGRYGKFKGCGNFPQCRFILK